MSLYLVTGGAGFIGSNLVEELLKRGESVRVLDNFSTGRRQNLYPFREQIEVVEGDIRSLIIVQQAMTGVDYVLHQAALPSVPRSVADPFTSQEVNVSGTLNVLLAARDAGVKRVVFSSSSSVYGNQAGRAKHEQMPVNPMSPYAVTKLAGEGYCRAFSQVYGLSTVVLRYFNVFGPRQDPNSQYSAVIPKFITLMMQDQPPPVDGDGTQSRDFTYVANVVAANLAAATQPGIDGGLFNVACGESYSVLDLINTLNQILGSSLLPQYRPQRRGDVMHSLADISAARQGFGYEPTISFDAGLRMTVRSFEDSTWWQK